MDPEFQEIHQRTISLSLQHALALCVHGALEMGLDKDNALNELRKAIMLTESALRHSEKSA